MFSNCFKRSKTHLTTTDKLDLVNKKFNQTSQELEVLADSKMLSGVISSALTVPSTLVNMIVSYDATLKSLSERLTRLQVRIHELTRELTQQQTSFGPDVRKMMYS